MNRVNAFTAQRKKREAEEDGWVAALGPPKHIFHCTEEDGTNPYEVGVFWNPGDEYVMTLHRLLGKRWQWQPNRQIFDVEWIKCLHKIITQQSDTPVAP